MQANVNARYVRVKRPCDRTKADYRASGGVTIAQSRHKPDATAFALERLPQEGTLSAPAHDRADVLTFTRSDPPPNQGSTSPSATTPDILR